MTLDEQLDFLGKGTVDFIERKDLRAKLARDTPLTIKVGKCSLTMKPTGLLVTVGGTSLELTDSLIKLLAKVIHLN